MQRTGISFLKQQEYYGGLKHMPLRAPAAGSISDRCLWLLCPRSRDHGGTGATPPAAASRWRLSPAGIWRQAHFCETWNSSDRGPARGLPRSLARFSSKLRSCPGHVYKTLRSSPACTLALALSECSWHTMLTLVSGVQHRTQPLCMLCCAHHQRNYRLSPEALLSTSDYTPYAGPFIHMTYSLPNCKPVAPAALHLFGPSRHSPAIPSFLSRSDLCGGPEVS